MYRVLVFDDFHYVIDDFIVGTYCMAYERIYTYYKDNHFKIVKMKKS